MPLEAVNLALNPIKSVKQLLHIRPELGTGNVVARDFFTRAIEQDAKTRNLVELAFKQKAQQLAYAKQQAMVQRQAAQPKNDGLDDMAVHFAKEFINDNPWYDIKGGDEDSAIVLAIDGALHREGFRPDTEEYWDELRERAARRLPERFGESRKPQASPRQQSQQAPRQQRGGPAIGSGREHAPTSTRTEVYVSPERKQALIDAGVWDDPVLRTKYVKRYAEYDRNNRA